MNDCIRISLNEPTRSGRARKLALLGTEVVVFSDNPDATAYVARAAEIREDLVTALKDARAVLEAPEEPYRSHHLLERIRNALFSAGAL